MDNNCLFCKIIKGDIPADKIYEDDDLLAFMDIDPQAPRHFLVIPKKHISGPDGITPADHELMGKILSAGAKLARKNSIPHFRLVMNNGEGAGQTVFHLHMHVLGGRPMKWPPG